ncbi:hypothetical protein CIG75_04830 [Tumebacillus algifaecis]|uniref:Uncharacterized protein n=1 Tax=Tumebacillus algifaecis TaxID=1214604 RepID=A0A223CYW2_9BACL|nr:hypothetical protein [Tumebacillus algifaecis]ASS74374.1 hypothetical protein CIG75_04830 [Tumebacillus algifaecis]
MKKRISLLVTIAVLATGFGIYQFAKDDPYTNLQVGSNQAAFKTHENIVELETESDLVVLANFTGQREQFNEKDNLGRVSNTVTKSVVEVEKVLKGNVQKKDKINVFEDCYIWNNERYITTEGYKWMNEDGKYLLFLSRSGIENSFVIVGIYEGKYDVNLKNHPTKHNEMKKAFLDPEVEFLGHGDDIERFYKLKEQAVKKYGL